MNKDTMDQLRVREEIVKKVKSEMLGPGSEDIGIEIEREIITDSPLERYSLGVLFPQENNHGVDDEVKNISEDENLETNNFEEDMDKGTNTNQEKLFSKEENSSKTHSYEEQDIQEQISMANQMLPSAMGLTIFTRGNVENLIIDIKCAKYKVTLYKDCKVPLNCEYPKDHFGFNEYFFVEDNVLKLKKNISKNEVYEMLQKYPEISENKDLVTRLYKIADQCSNEKSKKYGYVRVPLKYEKNINIDKDFIQTIVCDKEELTVSILRRTYENNLSSFTIMLVNSHKGKKKYNNSYFQPQIIIDFEKNKHIEFVDNGELIRCNYDELSDEEKSLELLYLNKKNYSVGHGVATCQNINYKGKSAIWTDFFPEFDVPQLNFDIHEIAEYSNELLSMFVMSDLSKVTKDEKLFLLNKFIESYSKWIDSLECSLDSLEEKFFKTAQNHIRKCRKVANRMKVGVETLKENSKAFEAFELMNRAMTMQRAHSTAVERFPDDEDIEFPTYDYKETNAKWRPFQLAFILLNLESIVNESSDYRDEVELLWVPTGGGKTEAYLGITAFTIFYRRLNNLKESGGTTILMRYTLRLLAAQQFIRASILICACEIIRQSMTKKLGKEEISIGLWVGGTPTPNTNIDAKSDYKKLIKKASSEYELKNNKIKHNKFQVLKCPWCGTKLEQEWVNGKIKGEWGYDFDTSKKIFCPDEECDFKHQLPIQVVDEEIYKNPPTLLFGTVDKFAAIAWNENVGRLFALNKNNGNRQPELIIQDELHLISGPLGSMAGMYETAIDAMCSYKGVKPKIIASTATIRRADEQCKMLFNRNVNQFPPSGLFIEDSFFTREKSLSEGYGRKYVGMMASGKTTVTAQVRLLTILLQGINLMDLSDDLKDKYWTLVAYFNSIRELGKTKTLVADDVANNIQRLSKRILAGNRKRFVGQPRELTSRLESTEIIKTLKDLEEKYKSDDFYNTINMLLASNMISVGVDVARLNVMMVSGQPKLTSEYIQATSRVGRSNPGVVFILYNAPKARDRSHYEQFYAYHQSFYKFVEPTSVTPFSDQVRERALHAIFISMVRHMLQINEEKMAKDFDINKAKEIIDFIIDRADSTDYTVIKDQKEQTRKDLEVIIDIWVNKINSLDTGEELTYKRQKNDKFLITDYMNDKCENAFPTMQSMRSVDSQAGVELIIFEEEN